ncbi:MULTISPECIES: SMC-Scp complex subunit ScpB [unclassified Halomonas]|uniref:SMC-Scp complex subunit ScpB n=1 Tax=unclassified Halomonas TaxID=2609666 RepID=UPI0006DA4F7A|nr:MULTISPECIES: SMC-Scp complex subunit ScpB [unclassified Halomonas]KPQ20204.1 MAG: segregation and condensation protein ScpB [Halomonas sp. HL-93]SBR46373.1 condensin subunit ScpB [Halomonas sp. HL-93]SNY98725.1 condensin subunit ScpB [Halomonas sp. hl-4]
MREVNSALDEILEAALLAAGEPLPLERLETLFLDGECPSKNELREVLARLDERHRQGALELVETASGYQLRIRPRLSRWVSRLWDERPQRYSRALLETLALIAYRQPVTRSDIEDVRGVSVSSSIMRTLMERGWVRVVGHRDVPGRPAVYATSRSFLDDFGLKTLDELPPMHELVSGEADWQDTLGENDEQPLLQAPPTPEAQEGLDDTPETVQDAPPETADSADTHAETALTQPLSFADLEARLTARAQRSSDQGARTQTHDERSDDHESE